MVRQLASAQLPPSALRTLLRARSSTRSLAGWKRACVANNMPAPVRSQSAHACVFSNYSAVERRCDVVSPALWILIDLPVMIIIIISVQLSMYNVSIFSKHRFKVRFFYLFFCSVTVSMLVDLQ